MKKRNQYLIIIILAVSVIIIFIMTFTGCDWPEKLKQTDSPASQQEASIFESEISGEDNITIETAEDEIIETGYKIAYFEVSSSEDSNHFEHRVGQIFSINTDGSDNKKLTDYVAGCEKPVISPDGRFIAFVHNIYDKNYENIETRRIELFDSETNQLTVLAEGNSILDLGWMGNWQLTFSLI